MFCSTRCLEQALQTYHAKESQVLEILQEAQLAQSEWHIALRSILSHPLPLLLDSMKEEDKMYGSSLPSDESYNSNSLQSLLNLFSCELSWPIERLHFQAFVAYFYLKCLHKAGILGKLSLPDLSNEELQVVGVLMHLMNVSSTNSQEINIFDVFDQPTLSSGLVVPVGGSIPPSMVLLNHSCDPSCFTVQNGNCVILIADRTIQEGDEVSSAILMERARLTDFFRFSLCMPCHLLKRGMIEGRRI